MDEARANLPRRLPEWEKTIQPRLAAARASGAKAEFKPLSVAGVTSLSKSQFTKLEDGSYLAKGEVPATDTYVVEISDWSEPLTALQLEVLPHDSLREKGPGRFKGGNFVLSEVKLSIGTTAAQGTFIPLHSPKADATQTKFDPAQVLDGDSQTGWAVGGHVGKPHQLTIQLTRPIAPQPGKKLFLHLEQNYKSANHVIGRFRVLGSTVETEESIAPAAVVKVLDEYPDRRNPALIPPLYAYLEKVDPDFIAASSALALAQSKLAQATAHGRARHRPAHDESAHHEAPASRRFPLPGEHGDARLLRDACHL